MRQKIKKAEPFYVSFIVLTVSTFLMRAFENAFSDNNTCSWILFVTALPMGIITLANLIVFRVSLAPEKRERRQDEK